MEDLKKPQQEKMEREIVFSKSIKAGKRIYYLDVKKSRNEDMFLSVTESKKKVAGDDATQFSFEKHKIFLYKEDFEKFMDGMREVIEFIQANNKECEAETPTTDIDINFEI